MSELRERAIGLIHSFRHGQSRYQFLEENSGIAARKWKNMCNRVTEPSHEMLTALAILSPFYASWLLTGKAIEPQMVLKETNTFQQSEQAI